MTTPIIIFLILAILGIIDTGYLIIQYFRKKPLVCPFNEDCNKILELKWSKILGIRNEILGLLYYLFIASFIVYAIFSPELVTNFNLWILLITGFGFLYSLFLTLISMFIIKEQCFYCSASAIIATLLFINSLLLYFNLVS